MEDDLKKLLEECFRDCLGFSHYNKIDTAILAVALFKARLRKKYKLLADEEQKWKEGR